jgi:hypothetical protein
MTIGFGTSRDLGGGRGKGKGQCEEVRNYRTEAARRACTGTIAFGELAS